MLLQGIALHAVEGDPNDYQIFRRDMQQQMESIEGTSAPAELMIGVGAVLKALESYNSRTTRHLRMQGVELYHMIGMLTRAPSRRLDRASEQSVGRLREIEGRL